MSIFIHHPESCFVAKVEEITQADIDSGVMEISREEYRELKMFYKNSKHQKLKNVSIPCELNLCPKEKEVILTIKVNGRAAYQQVIGEGAIKELRLTQQVKPALMFPAVYTQINRIIREMMSGK